jgi:hypothetical protein
MANGTIAVSSIEMLSQSGTGITTIAPPATNSNFTQTLVPVTGTLAPLVSGTAVASTSGTSIDFTGIPSWVKRITISLDGVSFAAAGTAVVRLGVSNTLVTTGYVSSRINLTTTPTVAISTLTDGVASVTTGAAATVLTGLIVITNLSGNTWVASGQTARTNDNAYTLTNGSITLAGVLTNLSLVATTSTFDAGSINIMYE